MPWGIAATAVVGLYSANQQKKGADKAAGAAAAGSAAEIAERKRQYDLTRADQAPWLQAGTGALSQMQALNSGDFSSFKASPDYAFNFQQGQQALDRGAAARGAMYSGGHTADTIAYGAGLASREYGNYYGRLQSMANQGVTTGANLGSLGASMANQNANSINNATSARMSSYGTRADANSQFAAGIGNAFSQYMGGRNGSGSGWMGGGW